MQEIKTDFGLEYTVDHKSCTELFELIRQFQGKELKEYLSNHKNCNGETNFFPFLLNDDRVVVPFGHPSTENLNDTKFYDGMTGGIFSSFKGYLHSYRPERNKKTLQISYPRIKIRHLVNGKKLYFQEIDPLIGNHNEKLFPRVNIGNFQRKVYQLEKGRFMHSGERFELFESEEEIELYFNDFRQRIENFKKVEESQNKLSESKINGRNPFGEKFINKIDDIILDLPNALNCSNEVINSKIEVIEEKLYRNIITDSFADKAFLPLLAFIGKKFKTKHKSQWVMHYDVELDLWIPDIEHDRQNKKMYKPLLKILDSNSKSWYPLGAVYNAKDTWRR